MRRQGLIAIALAIGPLAGCVIETLHVPERTGGEQAVMARAIERACDRFPLGPIGAGPVRIEVESLAPDTAGFVESSLRLRLLRHGTTVVEEDPPAGADPAADARVLHVLVTETGPETRTRLLQIPFPIPVAAYSLPVGVTFWERQTEKSVVRLRGYVVGAASGDLIAEVRSSSGKASTIETVLFGIVGPFRTVDPKGEGRRGPAPTD